MKKEKFGLSAAVWMLSAFFMLTNACTNIIVGKAASADGMVTMDTSLMELYQKGRITKDTLLTHCNNYEFMVKRVGR